MTKAKLETLAARAGLGVDLGVAPPLVPAIHQATVYAYPSLEALEEVFQHEASGHYYYRNGHVNGAALETALATLEGAELGLVAASGMAAISAGLLALVQSGDHIVADRHVYGGTYTLLTEEFPRWGITTTLVDAVDLTAVEAAIQPTTKVLYLESLSNPTLRVADLPRLITLGHAHRLAVVVDNTFASPALMRPLDHGADLVFHSLAKYIGGHASAFGGAVLGRGELIESARTRLARLGGTHGAMDAWLVLHGLKTLGMRMRAHSENAEKVARFLDAHPRVRSVDFPGLASHPQHDLARALYPLGTGGMLSFELEGGYGSASCFVRALVGRIPLASSLADVSTTLSYPAGTSHRSLSPEARADIGVTDGLLRLSVGIEDSQDILDDLDRALTRTGTKVVKGAK